MKLTADMKNAIMEIAEERGWDYEIIAIRVQEVPFELGEIDHISHVWDDGDDTGEELSGLCCTRVDMMSAIQGEYYGDYLAVIGGNSYEYGEDVGEVIISDPVAIEIIC